MFIIGFICALVVACGKPPAEHSGASETTQKIADAKDFLTDPAPVEGLGYSCGSYTGVTDTQGGVSFASGDTCVFSVEGSQLGSTKPIHGQQIELNDLLKGSTTAGASLLGAGLPSVSAGLDQAADNARKFLMFFDVDKNADNGISLVIPSDAKLPKKLEFAKPEQEFIDRVAGSFSNQETREHLKRTWPTTQKVQEKKNARKQILVNKVLIAAKEQLGTLMKGYGHIYSDPALPVFLNGREVSWSASNTSCLRWQDGVLQIVNKKIACRTDITLHYRVFGKVASSLVEANVLVKTPDSTPKKQPSFSTNVPADVLAVLPPKNVLEVSVYDDSTPLPCEAGSVNARNCKPFIFSDKTSTGRDVSYAFANPDPTYDEFRGRNLYISKDFSRGRQELAPWSFGLKRGVFRHSILKHIPSKATNGYNEVPLRITVMVNGSDSYTMPLTLRIFANPHYSGSINWIDTFSYERAPYSAGYHWYHGSEHLRKLRFENSGRDFTFRISKKLSTIDKSDIELWIDDRQVDQRYILSVGVDTRDASGKSVIVKTNITPTHGKKYSLRVVRYLRGADNKGLVFGQNWPLFDYEGYFAKLEGSYDNKGPVFSKHSGGHVAWPLSYGVHSYPNPRDKTLPKNYPWKRSRTLELSFDGLIFAGAALHTNAVQVYINGSLLAKDKYETVIGGTVLVFHLDDEMAQGDTYSVVLPANSVEDMHGNANTSRIAVNGTYTKS